MDANREKLTTVTGIKGERETNGDALVASYGIGRRLATRVAALIARRVAVTPTLLAAAAQDPAVEKLLLSTDLLKSPRSFTEQSLRDRAAELGFSEAELLRLVAGEGDGWLTIALEDDLLVAEGADGAAAAGQGRALELTRSTPARMSLHEGEDLFTPAQVAELKLTALTSQNAEERIGALRKLVFAPMEGTQKAGIFLGVLVERDAPARLRREALRCFEQIGLRPDLADPLGGMFDEDNPDVLYCVRRVGVLLRDARRDEAALILTVLLAVLEQSRQADLVRELLRIIAGASEMLAGSEEKTELFLRTAFRHLERDYTELRSDVEAAINACAARSPDIANRLIWTEMQRSDSPLVRGVLVSISSGFEHPPERLVELAERSVREILNPRLPEGQRARLRYGLVRLGEAAAGVSLRLAAAASGAEVVELARLLDAVCTEGKVSDETARESVGVILDLLRVADAATRRELLRASLLWDSRTGDEQAHEVAAELVALMAELSMPDSLDDVQNAIERIGVPALRPAFEFMRRTYPGAAALRTAMALAKIVEHNADGVPEAFCREAMQFCMGLLENERTQQGAFAVTLAAVCGYTAVGAASCDAVVRTLCTDLWERPYWTDALDALAVLAGAPNISLERQQALLDLFDEILRAQGTVRTGARRQTEEGTVYEFGMEIEFDIRAVPAAVRGLERIYLSRRADEELRTRVVKRLLVLWEGASKVRVVWGPSAIQTLVNAMCSAACSPQADIVTKERLGESLLRFLNKISVIESIGEIFAQSEEASGFQELALRAGGRVLDEWDVCEPQDDERRLALLTAAGRIAANPGLDGAGEPVRSLRERARRALFRGLREGMLALRAPLLLMRDCPGMDPALRDDIDEMLGKIFGLVKSSPRG